MPMPFGTDPIEINNITIRQDERVPPGGELFYDRDGVPLGYGRIGETYAHIRGIKQITLNPRDYELAKMSHLRNTIRINKYKAGRA